MAPPPQEKRRLETSPSFSSNFNTTLSSSPHRLRSQFQRFRHVTGPQSDLIGTPRGMRKPRETIQRDIYHVSMTLNWSNRWIQINHKMWLWLFCQPQVLEDSMGYNSKYFLKNIYNFAISNPPKTNSTKNPNPQPPQPSVFGFPSFTHTFSMACFHLEIFLRLVRPYYRGALDSRHIFALATRPFPSQWQFFRRHWADVVWALKIKIHLGHKWSFDDNMVTRAKKSNFDHLFVDYLYSFMGFGQEENWNSWRILPFGLAKLWSFGRTWHRNSPTIPDLPGRFFVPLIWEPKGHRISFGWMNILRCYGKSWC